jgi:hypothetical protein
MPCRDGAAGKRGPQAIESMGWPPELLGATINGASKEELYEAAERKPRSSGLWGATAYSP